MNLDKKINQIKDSANPTELEKEHVPIIEAHDNVITDQPFTVKVTVPHVIEETYFIEWIKRLRH
jgi:desulfoferrodoxin (superoxide reductase-like protein)